MCFVAGPVRWPKRQGILRVLSVVGRGFLGVGLVFLVVVEIVSLDVGRRLPTAWPQSAVARNCHTPASRGALPASALPHVLC